MTPCMDRFKQFTLACPLTPQPEESTDWATSPSDDDDMITTVDQELTGLHVPAISLR